MAKIELDWNAICAMWSSSDRLQVRAGMCNGRLECSCCQYEAQQKHPFTLVFCLFLHLTQHTTVSNNSRLTTCALEAATIGSITLFISLSTRSFRCNPPHIP